MLSQTAVLLHVRWNWKCIVSSGAPALCLAAVTMTTLFRSTSCSLLVLSLTVTLWFLPPLSLSPPCSSNLVTSAHRLQSPVGFVQGLHYCPEVGRFLSCESRAHICGVVRRSACLAPVHLCTLYLLIIPAVGCPCYVTTLLIWRGLFDNCTIRPCTTLPWCNVLPMMWAKLHLLCIPGPGLRSNSSDHLNYLVALGVPG